MNRRSVFCLLFYVLCALWLLPKLPAALQTDMAAMLPEHAADPVRMAADALQNRELNGQIVLAAGADDADAAFQAAAKTAELWRQSGLFAQVDAAVQPDLAALRAEVKRFGVARLPEAQADLLRRNTYGYFVQRAEDALNPFSGSLLPLEQDWLGFGRFFHAGTDKLQWQPQNGMLYSEYNGKTWVWLRARLPERPPEAAALLQLLTDSQTAAAREGAELLGGGGALFAARAKVQAESESLMMSAAGVVLTFGLLLAVFRSLRVLALLLPVAAGVLTGLAATVAVFGHIHVLTLAAGSSLLGVLVDFPLHWLAPALFGGWQARAAMRRCRPVFALSLAVTAGGYLLLWFTPLPVLRQTAVFSAAALLGAFAATWWLLPPLFERYRAPVLPVRVRTAARCAARAGKRLRVAAALAAAVLLAGLAKLDTRDDIRNWLPPAPDLLAQARRIAAIGGTDGGGRVVLVQSPNADMLLLANRALAAGLQKHAGVKAEQIQSLNQAVLPENEQMKVRKTLYFNVIGSYYSYEPLLRQIGATYESVSAEVIEILGKGMVHSGSLPLAEVLRADGMAAWRGLYVGEADGQHAALMRLNGLDEAAWQRVAAYLEQAVCTEYGCARVIDQRQELNARFADTRDRALWLKVLSLALAWAVLWRLFGMRRGGLMIGLPVLSALLSAAVLGWLGVTLGLFALFGLLLVTAVGADYAVYALTAPEPRAARIAAVSLAAATTAVSFGLLALSGTPALAAFGLTVAAGCLFNWLGAVCLCGLEFQAA